VIAPLRRRHRHVLTLLALFVPVVYAAALVSRRSTEPMSTLESLRGKTNLGNPYPLRLEPLDLSGSVEGLVVPAKEIPVEPVLRYLEIFEEGKVVLEGCTVEVVLPAGNEPDTYVYWVGDLAADEMKLPEEARLIGGPLRYGEAANYFFRLSPEQRLGAGHLVLYSVAHMRIVASKAVEPVQVRGGGIY